MQNGANSRQEFTQTERLVQKVIGTAAQTQGPIRFLGVSARHVNDGDRRILTNAATGIITTVPELSIPQGIAVDLADNLLITDIRVVRKLDTSTGVITIVACGGTNSLTGDGGPATEAELTFAKAVAVDGQGNLFIADGFTRRIRAVRGPIP